MALSDERGGLQVAGKIKVLIGLALLVVTAGLLLFSDGESESINANSPRESSYDASRPELPGVYTCDGFTASGGPLAVAGRPRQVHEANRQPPMDGRDEHHEAAHPRLRDNVTPISPRNATEADRRRAKELEAELIAVFEEGELPLRTCFTPLVHEARLYFALMEGRGRQYASEVLFRPDNYPDYYNGTNIAYPPDTTEVVIRSGDFAVHYVQSGSLSASDQYAQKAANLLPQVKQQYIDMDYTEPPGDGDLGGYTDVYDVYITDLPSGIAGFCSASGTVGNPWPSYVVIDNKLSFEDVRSSTTLSSTLAHEFFHAIQYGYDPAERSWWKETTAVWAQDEIFDDINDYLLLVPYRMSAPHKPLDTADGRTEYGNVVWAKFLEERFPGTDMVRAIWEYQAQNRNTAIPENTMEGIAAVLAQQGYNVDDALGEYANWLYRKELFEEGSEYPSVVVARTVESYPTLVKTASLPVGSLSHLALHLIECEPDDSSSILSMTFDGEDTFPLSVYLLAVDEEGEDLFQKVPLNAAKSGNIILESFGTTYETALFIVLNSSYYRGGAAYDLSLSLQPPGRISLGSDQLSFSSTQGEAPPPRTLAVGNDGDGPLEWNAIPSREWITVEPASGTTESGGVQFVSVSVDASQKLASESPFGGYITFTSDNATNSPQSADVLLEVLYNKPFLATEPSSLDLSLAQGQQGVYETLAVVNNGSGEMDWTISADVPWLSFDIQGGVLASGEEAVVKVYADSAFLPLSTQAYTATISLTSDVASNSPLEVLTTVRVLPPDMLIGESDSYGHVAVSEDYNWIDIRAQDFDLSSFYSTFDDEALGFYLPFDMELFGTTLAGSEDVFYLSTNGLLTFASAGSMNSENTPLPSQITPNAVIAPFWADLRMTENSRLYGRIFGSDNGNSRFVIEWYRFVNKEDGQEYTFQVEVFEYGDVILRYESDFTSLTVGSIGIEDFTGTEGLQVALNTQTDFPPPSTAIRITTRGQEPLLSLTPLWQQVNVAAGAEFQATVGVRNTGSGTLEWSLSAAGPSMSLSSSSGVGDADITVSGSAAGLSAGQYLCTITGTSDNGYVWDDTVRILLNVYSGTPDTVAIALDAGWNAVYVPVYVRPGLSVANLFDLARDSEDMAIVSRVAAWSVGIRQDYEAGEGSGVVLSYGQGVLLYCSSAGELTFTGDFPVSSFVRLSAGENLVMTEEWSGGTVADIWNDLLPGTVSRLFTWDGGFRSSFTQGQGAGVELDEFPVLIRARASAVIQ